jgi:hypothetical protein
MRPVRVIDSFTPELQRAVLSNWNDGIMKAKEDFDSGASL